MAACVTCARELRTEWKFCVSCGTPARTVPAGPTIAAPELAPAFALAAPAPGPSVAPPALGPSPTVAPPALGPALPGGMRTRSREPVRRRGVNPLAIVALGLGCLASPLAALFGHLAFAQLSSADQRGRIPAIIGIVLGYGSLAFVAGMCVVYLVTRV